MTKYKLEDLKVGAVFKNKYGIKIIITVGKLNVFYYSQPPFSYVEDCTSIDLFLSGHCGDLVKPTKKIAYVEYWSRFDLSSKKACSKELWDSRTSIKFDKFIREFEIEVGEDGFPIDGAL